MPRSTIESTAFNAAPSWITQGAGLKTDAGTRNTRQYQSLSCAHSYGSSRFFGEFKLQRPAFPCPASLAVSPRSTVLLARSPSARRAVLVP